MVPSGTPPAACSGAGAWAYYDTWSRCHTDCSEPTFFNGFSFDGTAGLNNCSPESNANDGNPGNNFGDGPGICGLVFCWNLTAVDAGGLPPIDAYSVEIRVTADGVSGSYQSGDGPCNSPCDMDPRICFPQIVEPMVTPLNEPCPGGLFDLVASPETPGVTASWIDASGTVVAMGYTAMLPEGTYTLQLAKPNCAPKELEVDINLQIPVLEYTGPEDGTFFCYGESFSLDIIVTNAQVNFVNWLLNGDVVSNGTSYSVSEATPTDAGLYEVLVNYGENCDTTLMFNLDVGENPEPTITSDPADGQVCEGEPMTFTAIQIDGSPYPADYTLEWNSAPGSGFGTPFTIDFVFGNGPQTMVLTVTDPDGCSFDFEYPFVINETPVGDIFPDPFTVCDGATAVLTPTVTAGTAPFTYRWGPANVVTTLEYTVTPPYNAQEEDLFLEITDANGCVGFSNNVLVVITTAPEEPLISCDPVCTSELRFDWTSVDGTYYEVYTNVNFAGETLLDDNFTETSLFFDDLTAGDRIDIRIVPYAGTYPDGCPGPEGTGFCTTPLVSSPGFLVDFPMPFCADGGGGDLPLTVSAGDPGEFVFNSTDLGISGLGADASGTTDIPVPAFTGTANSATYSLDISYINLNGSCPADTTIELTAVRAPDAEFALDTDVICGTSGDFTATLVTASGATDTYQLTLADPTVGTVTNNNNDSWTINVTMAGTHALVMTSANGLNATCSETFTADVTLNEPPPVPVVVCGATGLDFVTFTWADTGHDSYAVNEISIPPGGILTRNGNSVTVSGLSVGDEVVISVTGITMGCADNTSAEESCLAQSCPEITLTIDPIATYCANDDELVTIAFTAEGSDGSGTTVFTIDGAANDGTFNPSTLGAGTYAVRLLLDEGCDFIATATIQINEVPSSAFSLPDGPICVGETVLGEIAGATESGFTYLWSTDASVNVTPGADDGERNFTFSAAGPYDISLVVTSADGCVGDEVIQTIEVVERLLVPEVTCDTVQMESVTFVWPAQALVDSFGIQVNGGPEFFQTGTTLFVGGLSVDSTVNISVIAYGDTPCPDLTPGLGSCTSVSCPALFIATPEDLTFCAEDPTTVRSPLTTTVTGDNGGGELTFSGPGVIRIGNDYFFDVDTAGVGEHLLSVDFEEGMCMAVRTFTYTVQPRPEAVFTVTNDSGDAADSDLEANGLDSVTVCVGQPFTLAYTGTLIAADSADFCYVYSPDAPIVIDTIGFETYVFAYNVPGVQRVCLTIKQDGCPSDTVCVDVICVPPPDPLVLRCGSNGGGDVIFTWNDVPGANVYELFDEGGNSLGQTSDTEYIVTGLLPGDSTSLQVVAVVNSPCGDEVRSGVETCEADSCPAITIDLSGVPDQLCMLDGDEFIPLTDLLVTGGEGDGVYTWSGPGVTRDTFFGSLVAFNEAGDTYTVSLRYEEAGPCGVNASFDVEVFDRPTALFLTIDPQCTDDVFTVTVGSTNFVGNDNVTIDFNGGVEMDDGNPDDGVYSISFPTPGTKRIKATVISNISGCPSEEAEVFVEVSEPLLAPVLDCGPADLEFVTFEWEPVTGATGYRISTDDGLTFSDLPAADLSFVLNGLAPGTTVNATVFATSDGPCGPGPEANVECTTDSCPPGVIEGASALSELCLDGTEAPIALTAALSEGALNGSVVWGGTGVVDNGDGTFDFDPAGLPAGDYVLTVNYDGPSTCDSEDQVTITLFDLPTATISDTPDRICVGQSLAVSFTGSAAAGATYEWNFGDATVTDLGNESYELTWLTAGIKNVSLVVTDDCTDNTAFTIEVDPTLDVPAPDCVAPFELDAVTFAWPAVAGAEGYRYVINGAPAVTTTDLSVRVDDLGFGQDATITVVAFRTGTTCNESPVSPTVTCTSRDCDAISLAPAAPQTEFCADETDPVLLAANPSGDDGTGEADWGGTGVTLINGAYAFDPVAAGVGEHLLTVMYVRESLCAYEDTLTMTVNAIPSADFTLSNNLICSTGGTGVALTGTADATAVYDWDFDGATANAGANESYDLSWPVAGTYTVTLTVTRNGCVATTSRGVNVESPADAGTATLGVDAFCEGIAEVVELSERLADETPGGLWAGGNLPAGALDAPSGRLNLALLNPGDYEFTYTVGGNVCDAVSSTVSLMIIGAPSADAGMGQTLTCSMGMVSLDGGNSETGEGYTYLWTSTDPNNVIVDADQLMIDVGQPGTYRLEVTNAIGCTAVSEVTVDAETEAPVMELEVSQITCFASDNGAISVTGVSGGRAPYTFTLNGEDRGASTLFAGLMPAEYILRITDANGCFSEILLDITQPEQLSIQLSFPGDSTTVNAGDDIFISAIVNGGSAVDTLLWQPDSLAMGEGRNGISFTASETRMISVTVVDELGCTATDRQMLLVRRDRPVYFPTAFSPNGDNINDVYFIGGDLDQVVAIRDFFIFDRWGEMLYSGLQNGAMGVSGGGGDGEGFPPNDSSFGWDGMLNGKMISPQVCVYTATVEFSDGEVVVYKGDFVIMR